MGAYDKRLEMGRDPDSVSTSSHWGESYFFEIGEDKILKLNYFVDEV
jgi:hypothetical protein